MEHQDALPSCSNPHDTLFIYLFIFCANSHNSSGLICCSFPLASAFPLLPTNGLNGSGSQSATPVGGKSTTLLLFYPLSLSLLPLICCPDPPSLLPSFTCTQKDHLMLLELWLRHAGICSHRLLTWLFYAHAKHTALGALCLCTLMCAWMSPKDWKDYIFPLKRKNAAFKCYLWCGHNMGIRDHDEPGIQDARHLG